MVVGVGAGLWFLFGSKTSNPHNYATVGDIPTPWGYERIGGVDIGYSQFLRSLPLQERGSKVQLFTGGDARFQSLCYAVVDNPHAYRPGRNEEVSMGRDIYVVRVSREALKQLKEQLVMGKWNAEL